MYREPGHDRSGSFGIRVPRVNWVHFWQTHAEKAVTAASKILVIVIAYLIVRFLLAKLIRGVLNSTLARRSGQILKARQARIRAMQSVLMSAVSFILGFVAIVMIFQAGGMNIIPLITTASVAGLAIGFGAQKLVRDVISGFFMLVEDQYGIGDYVTIGGITGVVEDLEMRTTRIRDAGGKLYILSNGDISQVCNHSRGKLTLWVDYALAPSSDLDKALSVLEEIGTSVAADFPKDVKEPFKCEGIVQVTAVSTVVRLSGGVVPAAQDRVRLQLNKRVREAFTEHKDEIALA